jgi:SAM-dependent methyltransferase
MREESTARASEFDNYAADYADHVNRALPPGFGEVDKYARIKVDRLVRAARAAFPGRGDLALLDAGCGVGLTDFYLKNHFAGITCFDVSSQSIEHAARRNPELRYASSADGVLPFGDGVFDMAFAICVFHHVPPDLRTDFLRDLHRVLKPGGLLVIGEHNPWNPLTRRVVANCEFDRDAILLTAPEGEGLAAAAGFCSVRTEYLLFLPFEWAPWAAIERHLLPALPLGAQYFVSARKAAPQTIRRVSRRA